MATTSNEPAGGAARERPESPPHRNDEGHPFFVISLPERLAEARAISEEVIRWVERADLKATILIGGAGAMFGGELLVMEAMVKVAQNGAAPAWAWVAPALLIASMIVLTGAGVLAAMAVYPRLGKKYEHTGESLLPGDLLFFGRLRKIPPHEFVRGMNESLDHRSLIEHYAEQIHFNSRVAWKKYRHIRASLYVFGAAGVLAITGLVVYVLAAGKVPPS